MLIENDFFPPFSKQEFERRHTMVRKAMKEKGLDCLVFYGAYSYAGYDSGQPNLVYMTNYAGINHSYLVFPADGDPTLLICHALHVPNAKDIAAIEDIRGAGNDLVPGLCQRMKDLRLDKAKIGVVGPLTTWWSHTWPIEHDRAIKEAFPHASFEVVTPWFEKMTLIRSDEEIRLMEKAGALCDLAHEELFMATRPGVTHAELRRIIEGVANRFGGRFPFSHISSTPMDSPRWYYPDFYPTRRKVGPGEVAMTEMALGYGMYFGKIWGTYFIGEPTPEYRKLFELAASVHDKAVKELKPGMTGRDVQQWVKPFEEAGCTQLLSLVGGWSVYNHAPSVGAIESSPVAKRARPEDLDFVFQPGHCIGINSFPVTKDLKKGVWVGGISVMTKDGLKKLHAYPYDKLRVIPA